ncbi:hypothetical protein ABG067_004444 [Albugo candida]
MKLYFSQLQLVMQFGIMSYADECPFKKPIRCTRDISKARKYPKQHQIGMGCSYKKERVTKRKAKSDGDNSNAGFLRGLDLHEMEMSWRRHMHQPKNDNTNEVEVEMKHLQYYCEGNCLPDTILLTSIGTELGDREI